MIEVLISGLYFGAKCASAFIGFGTVVMCVLIVVGLIATGIAKLL